MGQKQKTRKPPGPILHKTTELGTAWTQLFKWTYDQDSGVNSSVLLLLILTAAAVFCSYSSPLEKTLNLLDIYFYSSLFKLLCIVKDFCDVDSLTGGCVNFKFTLVPVYIFI